MTKKDVSAAVVALKELISDDADLVREAVRAYLQEVLDITEWLRFRGLLPFNGAFPRGAIFAICTR